MEHTGARTRAALPGTTRTLDLPSIDAAALSADKDATQRLWATVTGTAASSGAASARTARTGAFHGGVEKIWLDGKAEATLDRSTAQVGAPEAWAAGFDGTGATVAVLDTGIDATHPDVTDQIAGSTSFVPGQEVTTDVQGTARTWPPRCSARAPRATACTGVWRPAPTCWWARCWTTTVTAWSPGSSPVWSGAPRTRTSSP
nr:hypothetical protein GCM10025730_16540 [Promicromonospora thailandica]